MMRSSVLESGEVEVMDKKRKWIRESEDVVYTIVGICVIGIVPLLMRALVSAICWVGSIGLYKGECVRSIDTFLNGIVVILFAMFVVIVGLLVIEVLITLLKKVLVMARWIGECVVTKCSKLGRKVGDK